MNICKGYEKKPVFVQGNLYECKDIGVCIYNRFYNTFVALGSGYSYTDVDSWAWEDVTDQYCLKKV